jgi:hypothetical protein
MFTPASEHPSTVVLLLAGLATFFGLIGLGRLICRSARISAPGPWEAVLWALTGMLVASLTVEIAAISFRSTRGFWIGVWILTASAGLYELICRLRSLCWTALKSWLREPFALIAIAADVVTLLIALAPSSKFDELFYHMLAPQRVLLDGGLHFYRFPWQSAILPQMHYQLSQTPLHAIGLPDAANVVSWCYSILLQIFIARLVHSAGRPLRLAALAAACVSVGMIPAVWYVTAGAHAVGDLASAALLIFVAPGGINHSGINRRSTIALASILAIAAASTKLTLLPLAVACLLWIIIREWRSRGRSFQDLLRVVTVCGALWLIFYGPLAAFTAWHSGSPFAVVMPGSTGASAYAPGEIDQFVSASKAINQVDLPTFLFQTAVGHSPLLWLAAIALFLSPTSREFRWYWLTITTIEFLIVTVFTHNDLRFLAGYPCAAIALLLLSQVDSRQLRWLEFAPTATLATSLLGLLPWLLVMGWYARPFAACSFGLRSRESFVEQYTALRRDFLAIDPLLPRDAVLLSASGRLNSVNAPRPVFYDVRDLPAGRPVFVLSVDDPTPEIPSATIGVALYDNDSAVTAVYRRPGEPPRHGTVRVFPIADRPAR